MGDVGRVKGPYKRPRVEPKLAVTGRLEGQFCGRPVAIEFRGREANLQVDGLRSTWRLWRLSSSAAFEVVRRLAIQGFIVRVLIGDRVTLNILPNPPALLRAISPALRRSTLCSSRPHGG